MVVKLILRHQKNANADLIKQMLDYPFQLFPYPFLINQLFIFFYFILDFIIKFK
jgi:hypothetical protein